MGDSSINKVDMSLDDIIKLNKKTKKGVSPLNRKANNKAPTGKGGATRRQGVAANGRRNLGSLRNLGGNNTGRVNKQRGTVIQNRLQKKRLDALKKLREAKQTLAMISKNTNLNSSVPTRRRGPQYQSKPQLNLSQTSRTRRNNNNNIQNQINQSPGTKRPRINRNYGNNLSLAQLGNSTGQKLNKKFSASYISLSTTSGVSNVRNGQGNRQRGQRRRNNQWNNNDQSFDDTITVSVPNNQQNRRRNKKQKKFNFKVQPDKRHNYEFDTNTFSSLGTNVSLSERFTNNNNNKRRNKTQQWGRQVFY